MSISGRTLRAVKSGDDLRRARLARRLSLAALSDQLGISAKTLTRWEKLDPLPEKAIPVVERFLEGSTTEHGPTLDEASPAELIAALLKKVSSLERAAGLTPSSGGRVQVDYYQELPAEVANQPDAEAVGERTPNEGKRSRRAT